MKRVIAASLLALSIAPPATAQDQVRISPVPSFTIQLSKDWIVCDKETNALLGGRPDTERECRPPSASTMLSGYNTNPPHSLYLTVMHKAQVFGQDFRGDAFKAEICATLAAYSGCHVETIRVADHPAYRIHAVTGPAAALTDFVSYFVPYEHGIIQIVFLTPRVSTESMQTRIEAIVGSLQFED